MQLIKYDPFAELKKIDRDFDKLLSSGWDLLPTFTESMAMDMYEEDGNLIAEIGLPNFSKSEINVSTNEGVLEISASHKEDKEKKSKRQYYFQESSNQYFRRVALPKNVIAQKTEAELRDGILKVTIPMTASVTNGKAKTVTIK